MINQQIAAEKKALILAEASVPGCVIARVAKSHNISKILLYKWIKQNK